MEKGTALEIVRAPQSPPLGASDPRNFVEALRIAAFYASTSLLGKVRSPEAALLIMAVGAELSIPATTALRAIHIVKGKPVLSSDLLVALCVKRPDVCEYFVCTESTDKSATYETKRKGRTAPISNTFTIEDASRAKLGVGNPDSNWGKYPKAMLRHRAAAELARQVYPDIVLGLYSDSEEDEIRGEVDVTPVQVVTHPVKQATAEESTATLIQRWKSDLFTAATAADCDKVAKEMKGKLVKGTAEYGEMVDLYKSRMQEIKAGAPREGEVIEREPGSDDA